jgi:hypothetical protein
MLQCRYSIAAQPHGARRLFGSRKPVAPTAAELEEEARWRAWADDRLVKVLTANLYASMREAYQSMEYIMDVDSFSYFSQLMGYGCGGAVMWAVGRRLPTKYGLEGKDLRAELVALVNEFVDGGARAPPSAAIARALLDCAPAVRMSHVPQSSMQCFRWCPAGLRA